MRFLRQVSFWVGTYHNDGMVPHSALDFSNLWLHGIVFRHGDWEFTNLDQDVTQESGDFLHQRLRSDQHIEGFAPLLNELLILVEFSETLLIDWFDSDGSGLLYWSLTMILYHSGSSYRWLQLRYEDGERLGDARHHWISYLFQDRSLWVGSRDRNSL